MDASALSPEDIALKRAISAARRRRIFGLCAKLLRHPSFLFGLVVLLIYAVLALFADHLAPYAPNKNNYRDVMQPPSADFWFGTDSFGRDVLSRAIYGTRASLTIAISVTLITGICGTILGTLAAYIKPLDGVLMRLLDGLMAFPGVLLAIALAAALGPSTLNAVIALSIAFTPRTARVVRASVMVVMASQYVEAARAIGASHLRMVFRYLLANALSPLIVQLTYVFAVSIIAEAILSFLGVGPPPPAPSLGNIIADGRTYIQEAWWIAVFPGAMIAAAVLALNLMGDGLRDILDPRYGGGH